MGFNNESFLKTQNVRPFYRNSYLCKPFVMHKMMAFMSEAMQIGISDRNVSKLLKRDADYHSIVPSVAQKIFGSGYYEYHPFIYERLPIFFVYFMDCSIIFIDANLTTKHIVHVEHVSGHSNNTLIPLAGGGGDSDSSMVLVYIIYYDTGDSKDIAMRWHKTYPDWTLPAKVNSSAGMLESLAYHSVLSPRYHEWKDKLYVGVISYSSMNHIGHRIMRVFYKSGIAKLAKPFLSSYTMEMVTYDIVPFFNGPSVFVGTNLTQKVQMRLFFLFMLFIQFRFVLTSSLIYNCIAH